MKKEISGDEFIKISTSEEVRNLYLSGASFIVATRVNCCNKIIAINVSDKLEDFFAGKSFTVQGIHCGKDNANNIKICASCDVVIENNTECPICNDNNYVSFSEDDQSDYVIGPLECLMGCIFLNNIGRIESPYGQIVDLYPGCFMSSPAFSTHVSLSSHIYGIKSSIISNIKTIPIQRSFPLPFIEKIEKALKVAKKPTIDEKIKTTKKQVKPREASLPNVMDNPYEELNELTDNKPLTKVEKVELQYLNDLPLFVGFQPKDDFPTVPPAIAYKVNPIYKNNEYESDTKHIDDYKYSKLYYSTAQDPYKTFKSKSIPTKSKETY